MGNGYCVMCKDADGAVVRASVQKHDTQDAALRELVELRHDHARHFWVEELRGEWVTIQSLLDREFNYVGY